MCINNRAVVFAEADSVFEHASPAEWTAAARVLADLRQDGVAVVISSRKTHAELLEIQELLRCTDPCVIERGSAVVVTDGYFPNLSERVPLIRGYRTLEFGLRREAVLAALYRAAALEYVEIVGLSDLSVQEIARAFRLSFPRARLVSQRGYSEKFMLLNPSELTHNRLSLALRAVGLECMVDNSFWQVDASPGFGPAVTSLRQLYEGLPCVVYSSNAPDIGQWAGSLVRIASGIDSLSAISPSRASQ